MVTKQKKTPTPRKTTGVGRAATQAQLETRAGKQTSARDWLLSRRGNPVEVPSGNVALVRRPGPEMFFKAGMVPDALTGIVNESVREKQGLKPEKMQELATSPEMLPKMLALIDSAVVEAVVDPPVRPNPDCIAPKADKPDELCGEIESDDIHMQSKTKGHHKFIEGNRIAEDAREPMFLYASEVDFQDKVFIFQYAVGGSPDLERFRQEFNELVDGFPA